MHACITYIRAYIPTCKHPCRIVGFLGYLTGLPGNAGPEVFGLHDNADITCAQNDTYTMFRTILSLQPRSSSGGGKSRDEVLTEAARDVLSKVPG